MNSQTAKTLRKFSELIGQPYKFVKQVYERDPKGIQEKHLKEIKAFIPTLLRAKKEGKSFLQLRLEDAKRREEVSKNVSNNSV